MDKEAQRIAIAEACGWTNVGVGPIRGWQGIVPASKGFHFDNLPDYLNDLNAMFEAERAQGLHKGEEGGHFAWQVYLLVRPADDPQPTYEEWLERGNELSDWSLTVPLAATAAQRAEAFLRALSLWK